MHDCEPRNFVKPCLLLLLRERPDHGYDLMERLGALYDSDGDGSAVYRALRSLEHDGLVCSSWVTSDAGPARRTYRLTPAGDVTLKELARSAHTARDLLDSFLRRYSRSHGCRRAGFAVTTEDEEKFALAMRRRGRGPSRE